MLGIKTLVRHGYLDLVSKRDVRRLRARHPELGPTRAELAGAIRELAPTYEEYVATVSTPGMAASVETSAYLNCLCRDLRVTSVLDLGSGFSSYVLRRYALEAPYPVAVTSVDHDPVWLLRTENFLRMHACPTGGLIGWATYNAHPTGPHDVVFHDLAGGQLREATMAFALTQVRNDGAIVFDDVHHNGHRQRMQAEAEHAGFELFSLRHLTLDSINRWAALGVLRGADVVERGEVPPTAKSQPKIGKRRLNGKP